MWKLTTQEEARRIWNDDLVRLEDCSPFQTFEWGQFHKQLGWEPLYLAFVDDDGAATSLFLGLLRKLPLKTGFVWCAGGPVGKITDWDRRLPEAILKSAGLRRLYLRFRCDRERTTRDALFLNNNAWHRCLVNMASSFSMELELGSGPTESLAGADQNWRRNLRLAEKNDLVVRKCSDPDIGELRELFRGMESFKGLQELFSSEKLEHLFKRNRSNLIFFRCEDREGKLLAFRGSLIIGDRACDYLAATSEEGRKKRAAFCVFEALVAHCRDKGIRVYDLGGIDPWENPGVYGFKRATGAREVEYLGEWDWASSSWLKFLGNWLISRRRGAKSVRIKAGDPAKVLRPAGRLYGTATRLVRAIGLSQKGIWPHRVKR